MLSRPTLVSAVTAICSIAVLTACSSSGGSSSASTGAASSPSSSASSSSSSSSSPAAAPSSSAAAGASSAAAKKFIGLTASTDSDLQGFLALPNSTTAATARAAAGKVAKDETTLIAALKKNTWPSAARADFTNLERTLTSEAAVYAKCAKSSTVPAIKSVLAANKATIAARVAASTHVRSALGIPNPTQASASATNTAA